KTIDALHRDPGIVAIVGDNRFDQRLFVAEELPVLAALVASSVADFSHLAEGMAAVAGLHPFDGFDFHAWISLQAFGYSFHVLRGRGPVIPFKLLGGGDGVTYVDDIQIHLADIAHDLFV